MQECGGLIFNRHKWVYFGEWGDFRACEKCGESERKSPIGYLRCTFDDIMQSVKEEQIFERNYAEEQELSHKKAKAYFKQ